MSALTRLAKLRIEEREVLATSCARCGHRLGNHSLAANHCAGEFGSKACRCEGWKDPGEQLALR